MENLWRERISFWSWFLRCCRIFIVFCRRLLFFRMRINEWVKVKIFNVKMKLIGLFIGNKNNNYCVNCMKKMWIIKRMRKDISIFMVFLWILVLEFLEVVEIRLRFWECFIKDKNKRSNDVRDIRNGIKYIILKIIIFWKVVVLIVFENKVRLFLRVI